MMYRVKQYASVPPPYGGVSVFVRRLVFALNKKGWISGAFYSKTYDGMPEGVAQYLDKFPKHSRSLYALPEMLKLLRIFRRYDLMHAHISFTACFTVWSIHKILKIPVVYTVHNQMIDKELGLLNALDRYCLKSLASDSTVQFVAVNPNVEKLLKVNGFSFKNPIEIMPAYIPPVEYGSLEDYLPAPLNVFLKGSDPVILFYAESMARYKGVEIYGISEAIEAYKQLKQLFTTLKMVLCITNVNSQDELKNYKDKLNDCRDSIYWQVGPLSEMWPLLKSVTLLLRPTRTDGDSIMIREALAYGLPVVASDVVDRPDGCHVYKYGNAGDLTDKLSSVLFNPIKVIVPQEDNTGRMMQIYDNLLNGTK